MSDDRDIDSAIAAYRLQLEAAAELARGNLDEIEDHLRTLASELRDTGLGAAEAVAEAARRLGEPRTIAREHARVRTAFGPRLSWPRALFAALLIAPILLMTTFSGGANMELHIELGAGFLLVAALLARLSWARPILLGGFGFFVLPTAMWLATGAGASVWFVAWFVAIVAVLAPWQRREISAAGIALALQVWAFGAASIALAYQVTSRDGEWIAVAPAAKVALLAAAIATCGGVLRAKWAAVGSAVAAIALAVAVEQMWTLRFNFEHAELYRVYLLGSIASGVVASGASALLGWTTARTKLGSLRAIFDRARLFVMTDLEHAIAAYRAELSAQADVASADLDELEDHFRSTVEQLRATGVTCERAIAIVLERIGKPAPLAREHVRVRTAFGPRLSRRRAWAAAAVLLPSYIAFVPVAARMFTTGAFGINLVLSAAMLAALIAGVAWARPIMLGAVLSSLAGTAIILATEHTGLDVARLAAFAAAALLLAPWRRGELPVAAVRLALLGPIYTAANTLFDSQGWAPGAHLLDRPSGLIAFAAVGVAGVGGILRSRWATRGAAIAAIALAVGAPGLWALARQMRLWHPTPWLLYMLSTVVLGIACAGTSALLGSARLNASRVRSTSTARW